MSGVLPNQEIEKLIEVGSITSDVPTDPEQIQPASLDLRLGGKAFRIRASFLPGSHEKVEDRLKSLKNRCPDRGPEKNMFFYEKATFRRPARRVEFDPKVVQNGIQKS